MPKCPMCESRMSDSILSDHIAAVHTTPDKTLRHPLIGKVKLCKHDYVKGLCYDLQCEHAPKGTIVEYDPLLGPGNPMERIGKALGVLDSKGKKNDEGKLRFDLIPVYPLEELARVYTLGAGKYDDHNWRKGFKWGRIFAAMCRHAWAWWRCERNDAQDGQLHLASVAWCAFTLMEFERYKLGEDNRWRHGDTLSDAIRNLPSVVRYQD